MPEPIQAGSNVAHYSVIRALGVGGMGEVFLAEDTHLNRKVALKLLDQKVSCDKIRLARFLQEARVAAAFNHPNVAHIYEMGEEAGVHFLAMEYVEGQTLEAQLEAGPMEWHAVTSAAAQVADALDAAHNKGIVHRDIKPANLILDKRGRMKVLDFGLAKILPEASAAISDETQLLSVSGAITGTVAYMSPEQALGHECDERTDLFSLGAVLYRALAGVHPFQRPTAQETIARILKEQPDPLARFGYAIPGELERITRKCLEKDPDRRYQSARDVLVDLRNLTAASTPSAESAEPTGTCNLRVVLVDDEELARHLLREYLEAGQGVEVVAECANGFEAVKAISDHKPDLVFLDVQMPKLDGFEVLELIDTNQAVIFVTAYDQYAMKAFDAHAVDYLLKPFTEERLWKAIERTRARLRKPEPVMPTTSGRSAFVGEARPPEQRLDRIVVRDGAKVHIIPAAKLDYIEAQDDYIALMSEGKSYLKQQTISGIEEQLDPRIFVRIHQIGRAHV